MYAVISEKFIRMKNTPGGVFSAVKIVHIVCDTAADIPAPLPEWEAGSRCDVTGDGGSTYMLNNSHEWEEVNFFGNAGGSPDFSNYYTKRQTDAKFVEKVSGKGLSSNDFTTEEKTKLAGLDGISMEVSGEALIFIKH